MVDADRRRIRCRVGTRAGPAGGQLCFRVPSTVGARKAALGWPLLKDGTRVQTVSSVENLWLAATAPDALAWPPRWLLRARVRKLDRAGLARAEFSRKGGVVQLGHDLYASRPSFRFLVSYRALASFANLARAERGRQRSIHVTWWLICEAIPTASSTLRERYDQRRVPAAVGATTARASRRSTASKQQSHGRRQGDRRQVVGGRGRRGL